MSGICGWVGDVDPAVLDAMLGAIDYRGDRSDKAYAPGVALGYRWWGGRPGKSPGVYREGQQLVACAGTFAPSVDSPAAALIERLHPGADGLDSLDGAFAAAWWDGSTQATARSKSGTVTILHLVDVKTIKIPVPTLATQQAIVAEIEAEQALVAANRELIARIENKSRPRWRARGEDASHACCRSRIC